MKALIPLLSQPSTYAGFSGLALAVGISDSAFKAFATAAAAVFALVAVVLNEKGGEA